jgi:hypothetical protein
MSHEPDSTRTNRAEQARHNRPTRELCGPAGTICGLAVFILLAVLIPA